LTSKNLIAFYEKKLNLESNNKPPTDLLILDEFSYNLTIKYIAILNNLPRQLDELIPFFNTDFISNGSILSIINFLNSFMHFFNATKLSIEVPNASENPFFFEIYDTIPSENKETPDTKRFFGSANARYGYTLWLNPDYMLDKINYYFK